MPVRKIPKNYRNVTGIAAQTKAIGEALVTRNLCQAARNVDLLRLRITKPLGVFGFVRLQFRERIKLSLVVTVLRFLLGFIGFEALLLRP